MNQYLTGWRHCSINSMINVCGNDKPSLACFGLRTVKTNYTCLYNNVELNASNGKTFLRYVEYINRTSLCRGHCLSTVS